MIRATITDGKQTLTLRHTGRKLSVEGPARFVNSVMNEHFVPGSTFTISPTRGPTTGFDPEDYVQLHDGLLHLQRKGALTVDIKEASNLPEPWQPAGYDHDPLNELAVREKAEQMPEAERWAYDETDT